MPKYEENEHKENQNQSQIGAEKITFLPKRPWHTNRKVKRYIFVNWKYEMILVWWKSFLFYVQEIFLSEQYITKL